MLPWNAAVKAPPRPPTLEDSYGAPPQIVPIQFRVGYDGDFDPNTHCWYACYSCYAATGVVDSVFKTGGATADSMKLGPTEKQQGQMREHAEQHSIIWSWARQQDR